MKKITLLLLVCFATICLAQDKIPAIITKPGAATPLKQHGPAERRAAAAR